MQALQEAKDPNVINFCQGKPPDSGSASAQENKLARRETGGHLFPVIEQKNFRTNATRPDQTNHAVVVAQRAHIERPKGIECGMTGGDATGGKNDDQKPRALQKSL